MLYIAGMFEDETNPLFLDIKDLSRQLETPYHFIKPYSGKPFGSYSFQKEVRHIERTVTKKQPQIIIAHSLGCYIAIHISVAYPLVLLDPSLSISDVILPNVKRGIYNDGTYTFQVSSDFLSSIETSDSIEVLVKNINKGHHVDIFGAGKAGYKSAEQYHKNLADSRYFFLSSADHEFSDKLSKQKIIRVIKKRLGIKQPSHS